MMKNVSVVKGRARTANTLVLLVSCTLSIGITCSLELEL
jgi:hypothetical protein